LRPVQARGSKNLLLEKEKKSAGESSAAAQDGNSDLKKVIKEEASKSRILPKTPPAADGNMNPGNYIPKAVIVSFCFS